MNDFMVVTCCNRIPTEPYYCIASFVKSLKEDVDRLIVLDERLGKWDGLGTKPKWLYKAIKEEIIDSEFIIFTDCWDYVFAEKPSGLFNEYLKWDKGNPPIIISAEKNCFPADLKQEYDKLDHLDSPYKYLNSGMIIGKTSDILIVLEAMDLDNVPNDYRQENGQMYHVNDQFLYQQIFLKQPVKMELDYCQLLCNTLHDVKIDELELDSLGVLNKTTGAFPMSFHFNGGAKTGGLMEPILKNLNLI